MALNLRSRVDLVRIFKKLSGPFISVTEDYQLSLLDLLSPIPTELIPILENPARLWSCSLSREEFLLADHVEMKQHYAYVWLIPLWLVRYDDVNKHGDEFGPHDHRPKKDSFMFWNCHTSAQIELNLDSYLSSGRQIAESDLIDVVLTFGGASFIEPVLLFLMTSMFLITVLLLVIQLIQPLRLVLQQVVFLLHQLLRALLILLF